MGIRVANTLSRQQSANALVVLLAKRAIEPDVASHFPDATHAPGVQTTGTFRASIKREVHPVNWNKHSLADPLVWGGRGVDMGRTGLRRKLEAETSISLTREGEDAPSGYIDAYASIATRFDRELTLFRSMFRIVGLEGFDDTHTSAERIMVGDDIDMLETVFAIARDIRPVVSPVRRIVAHRAVASRVIAKYDLGEHFSA